MMKGIGKLTLAVAMMAGSALADERLTGMRDHARELEREYRGIHEAIKSKTFSPSDLQARLDGSTGRVTKLKELAAEIESGNPSIASKSDWKTAKDLVTLIDIFHAQKTTLVTEGAKKRTALKVHAEGLAKRSAKLAEVTDQLARSSS